ncbi:fatty acid cis/trans isomerase [Rubrimonas cliftonensis]|uniref:Fatty acid cis/trans isomerase (CTI) n=1 Tax=Rubrimonas cliftonensis TaxID=89524 RepID=A0A1H4FRP2_9RHOB|nr:fatty acid cis/trans isomerase [Rubrimonas cliftonensis]SEA99490.1 Fatty acid cis/trans isomerase (CTI) [Rubrimonas cliftonensis]
MTGARIRRFFGPLAGLALVAALTAQCAATNPATPEPPALLRLVGPGGVEVEALGDRASEVLARRCVACHGCYDAACQLKLVSHEGALRGGVKAQVYDQSRLAAAPPTRLGVDARTTAEWRVLGFHPVLPDADRPDPDASVMARLIALARANPPVPDAPLPEALTLDTLAASCPAPDEIADHVEAAPHGGMPYGAAPLSDSEFETLATWILAGAPPPTPRAAPSPAIAARVAAWERFLNGASPRERLVARYLYEHLFHAKLHLDGGAPDRFFRLIRSETPTGEAPYEIATRRPWDDPGRAFHYRLAPAEEVPVHKDQNVYALSPARIARLRALFLDLAWTVDSPPPYGEAAGANPFLTFAAIPADSRYRFLLDDALFFVRGFVRGPVCHGQIATNVIEDRFWVAFLDPGWDLAATDLAFLREAAPLLKLAAAQTEGLLFQRLQAMAGDGQAAWLALRDSRYAASLKHAGGFPLEALWTGDEDAFLTVVRHFDNAAARRGLIGDDPETAWVIDYPLFERLHYDLVASYDVFGDVEHQLATRLSMDHLRREGEDLFLSFLPPEVRPALHDAWYRGPLADLHAPWAARRAADARPAAIAYDSARPMPEFLAAWRARVPPSGDLNRCSAPCGSDAAARALSRIAGEGGPWVAFLPDLTLLRLRRADGGDAVFSLIRDKAHANIALLLGEALRREPEADRLTVATGVFGAYPNFHFDVEQSDVEAFVDALSAMRTPRDWMTLVDRFGVRRSSTRFWPTLDAINAALAAAEPTVPGLLDLGRYRDPRAEDRLE